MDCGGGCGRREGRRRESCDGYRYAAMLDRWARDHHIVASDGSPLRWEWMMGRFTGRVAVVTGGAQGIGAAIAERLAGEGAVVGVLDLTAERARATVDATLAGRGRALAWWV